MGFHSRQGKECSQTYVCRKSNSTTQILGHEVWLYIFLCLVKGRTVNACNKRIEQMAFGEVVLLTSMIAALFRRTWVARLVASQKQSNLFEVWQPNAKIPQTFPNQSHYSLSELLHLVRPSGHHEILRTTCPNRWRVSIWDLMRVICFKLFQATKSQTHPRRSSHIPSTGNDLMTGTKAIMTSMKSWKIWNDRDHCPT